MSDDKWVDLTWIIEIVTGLIVITATWHVRLIDGPLVCKEIGFVFPYGKIWIKRQPFLGCFKIKFISHRYTNDIYTNIACIYSWALNQKSRGLSSWFPDNLTTLGAKSLTYLLFTQLNWNKAASTPEGLNYCGLAASHDRNIGQLWLTQKIICLTAPSHLFEPILAYYAWGAVTITWKQLQKRYLTHQLLKSAWKLRNKSPRGHGVNSLRLSSGVWL